MYDYDYDYSYDYGTTTGYDTSSSLGTAGMALTGGVLMFVIIDFAVFVLLIVSMCKIFIKYGKKWWEFLIYGYNTVVMLEMAEMPLWNYFIFLIPFVNIYILFKVAIRIAKAFGKGTGFGVGMVLLPIIFIPILAFSKAQYVGIEKTNTPVNPEPPVAPVEQQPIYNQQPVQEPVMQQPIYNQQPAQEPVMQQPVANDTFPSMSNVVEKPASESTITQGMPEAPVNPVPVVEPVQVTPDSVLAENANIQNIQNTDFLNNQNNNNEQL